MKTKSVRLQSQPVLLQAPDPVSVSWNVIAVPGHFEGHQSGRAFDLNRKVFEEIIANFRADPLGRINVDHNHESETLDYQDEHERGDDAPAWITELEVRKDGNLWGKWEWTDPKVVERVREGRLRYLSPAVVFNAVHPETGKRIGARLSSVALTNKPFLRRIPTVNASLEELPSENLVVGGQELSTQASLQPTDVHIPGSVKVKPMADSTDNKRYTNFLKKMRALMEMSEPEGDADDLDQIFDKASALKSTKMSLEQKETLRLSQEADELVKARVDAKVISADAAPKAKALCLSDRASFDAFFPMPAKPAAKKEEADDVQLSSRDKAILMTRQVTRQDRGEQTDGNVGATADYRTQLFLMTEDLASKALAADPKLAADVAYLNASAEAKRRLAARAEK